MTKRKRKNQIVSALNTLKNKYIKAERMMADREVSKLKELLPGIDAEFNKVMDLCVDLSDNDSLPGSTSRKVDCIHNKEEFDSRVQHWLKDSTTECSRDSDVGATTQKPISSPLKRPPSEGGSRSIVSSTSSIRSLRAKESRVKLQLARLAREQDAERRSEELQLADQETARKKEEADREVARKKEEADRELARKRLEAKIAERESQRALELVELEAKAWEESSNAGNDSNYLAKENVGYPCNVVKPVELTSQKMESTRSPEETHQTNPVTPLKVRADRPNSPIFAKHNPPPVVGNRFQTVDHWRTTRDFSSSPEIPRALPRDAPRYSEVGERFLPKPLIENFDGDPMDYWSFTNRYKIHIADKVQSDDLRLVYLLQHCSQNVCEKLKHYTTCAYPSDGYKLAWRDLYDRYGQPHIIARCCEERLQETPKIGQCDPDGLERLAVLLKRCCAALDEISGSSSVDSVGFILSIVRKLPVELQREWVSVSVDLQHNTGKVARFVDFADFVCKESIKANSIFGKGIFTQNLEIPAATTSKKKQRAVTYNTVVSNSQSPRGGAVKKSQCPCCSKSHKLEVCYIFKRKSYRDRKLFSRSHKLCYRCLGYGHNFNDCKSNVTCSEEGCGSVYHHVLLHNSAAVSPSSVEPLKEAVDRKNPDKGNCMHSLVSDCNAVQHGSAAYLDIVPIRVHSNGVEVETYALLDSGANRSFCERKLIEMLDDDVVTSPVHITLNTLTATEPRMMQTVSVPLTVGPLGGGAKLHLSEVIVVDEIPASQIDSPKRSIMDQFDHLRDIHLPSIEGGSVTLIIGNDNAVAHRCLESRFAPDPHKCPDAVKTPLGWLLKGPMIQNTRDNANVLLCGAELNNADDLIVTDDGDSISSTLGGDLLDAEAFMQWLRRNREAMEFGLKYSKEDVVAYEKMIREVQHTDGHYQLPLLWRDVSAVLPDSLPMAQRRLEGLKKRLVRDGDLRNKYVEQMQILIEKSYCEVVPADELNNVSRKWFIPHHPVVNPRKPGKLRIVFDCAAKCKGQSINDKFMKGPDLMNSLVGVLMRFRREAIAVVADIEAMFYQVRVAPHDRDAFRFLWWPEGDLSKKPIAHRMTVHLFGAKSSPSCATFCLRETAKEFGKFFDPRVSEVVRKNFYVDDCLSSVATDADGIKLVHDLRKLLALGGFKLTKWLSSSEAVMEVVPQEERSKAALEVPLGSQINERVLGISWCVSEDEFKFNVDLREKPHTKRGILSVTNSLFDPLGFVAPVVLEARLIYRELCQRNYGWDEDVSGAELKRWKCWLKSLSCLPEVSISRCYKMNKNACEMQLHCFADASTVARGSVCYLRCIDADGVVTCTFLMGRSLLCSLGKQTIPRLELEAALDAVKLSRMVKQELCLQDCRCIFWTDSTIVLQSLYADSKNFPVFSRNRLSQIQTHSCVHDWMHVPSNLNPADQASRGLSAAALVNSGMWLSGPAFLKQPPEEWPNRFIKRNVVPDDYTCFEAKKGTEVFVTSSTVSATDHLVSHFSSLHRLKLATCWLLRFKSFLRSRTRNGSGVILSRSPITVKEMKAAEVELVKFVQRRTYAEWFPKPGKPKSTTVLSRSPVYKLNPMVVDGVLRVGGRLSNAPLSYEAKHPAILPQKSHLTDLIVMSCHENLTGHSGVNYTLSLISQRYWIVNARVAIRGVVRSCLLCRRRDVKPGQQLMADLPVGRLQIDEPPFSHVGCDYFGPIIVKQRRNELKRYGCLFTCLTTRAIHLEVAADLSTSTFINALRRFVARRGPVRHMYSDNGTNFVGAERLLRESIDTWNKKQIHDYLRQQAIEWTFNPPAASHMGGAWERMIRSVRRILMAITPGKSLDDDCLHTLFIEVEQLVNSRPLTDVPLEVGEEMPLTPNHLLRIDPMVGLPPMLSHPSDCYARHRYRVVQHVADEFWQRWTQEYPRTIMTRPKWLKKMKNLAVGDVVLLVDHSTPRGHWPLGRVDNLYHDKHGIVRSVDVKTIGGILRRPIAKLCLIAPAAGENESLPDEPDLHGDVPLVVPTDI